MKGTPPRNLVKVCTDVSLFMQVQSNLWYVRAKCGTMYQPDAFYSLPMESCGDGHTLHVEDVVENGWIISAFA